MLPLNPWNIFQHVQHDSASPLDRPPRLCTKVHFETSHSFYFNHSLGDITYDTLLRPTTGPEFFFNQFHNPHFQVHHQELSCSLYAQPLKQAQENYQVYTLKDNLS